MRRKTDAVFGEMSLGPVRVERAQKSGRLIIAYRLKGKHTHPERRELAQMCRSLLFQWQKAMTEKP